jgi:DNA-binding LytR/AlgR family response regulator
VTSDQLTILAVDDERTQLEDLARLLRNSPSVREVECAYDGHDALVKASTQTFDAIFLDVRMPQLDGLELGRVLRRFAAPPQLVFVSAYDSAAVDAFELHALDYLLKPVGRKRVEEAIERVAAAIESTPVADERNPAWAPAAGMGSGPDDHEMLAVANLHGGSTRLLARSSILYVQSYGDFVRIVTADGRFLLRSTLAEIERRWEPVGFVRVHRQYVANLRNAVELRPMLGGTAELAFGDGQTVPVARRHTTELGRRLSV